MIVAAVRRIVFKPARYAVPPRYGKGHPADAIFLLSADRGPDVCRQPVCGERTDRHRPRGREAVALFSLAGC